MNIQNFISTVSPKALARIATFEGIVTGPTEIGSARDLTFMMHTINFPGRTIQATDLVTYGPTRSIAVGQSSGTVDVSVYLSSDFSEKVFFQRWQSLAVGYGTMTSSVEAGMFDLGYYSSYIGTVNFRQLDPTGATKYTCTLEEAWPIVVSPLTAEWGSDDVHKLGVTFAFRRFYDDTDSSAFSSMFPSTTSSTSS